MIGSNADAPVPLAHRRPGSESSAEEIRTMPCTFEKCFRVILGRIVEAIRSFIIRNPVKVYAINKNYKSKQNPMVRVDSGK
jgi:hypothetical protein